MTYLRAAALAALILPLGASLFAAPQQDAYPDLSNFGDPPDRAAAWFQQCLRVQDRQPLRDLRPTPQAGGGKHCKAGNLYYDKLNQSATTPGEWDQVRHCALASNDTSVLMMLYANGFGVSRDVDLAVRYACGSGGAPAELEGRVMHLAGLNESNGGKRFDQCDDITSGSMGGYCASIAEAQAAKVRSAFLARVRKAMTAPQQMSFDALLKSANAFAVSRGNVETDMTGTARAAMAINAEAREQEWLREHIAAFEKGHFKLPAAEQYEAADGQLNLEYQRIMQSPVPDSPGWSTVEKSGVRTTQRAWLAYRDAWIRFAALRYPELDAASLKTALTQWRGKQLARLAAE